MTSDIIMGVVILVLILLSAFFSAIETAFSFVNKVRVQRYKDDGNKKAAAALYIIEHFDNALTTILICNNVVNLSCSSIATVLCMNLFGDAGSAIATGATTFAEMSCKGTLRCLFTQNSRIAQRTYDTSYTACVDFHTIQNDCLKDCRQQR